MECVCVEGGLSRPISSFDASIVHNYTNLYEGCMVPWGLYCNSWVCVCVWGSCGWLDLIID